MKIHQIQSKTTARFNINNSTRYSLLSKAANVQMYQILGFFFFYSGNHLITCMLEQKTIYVINKCLLRIMRVN